MKKAYRNRFNYGSKFIDNNGVCVYCGNRANTLDHFVPLAVLYMMGEIGGGERVTLECCSECNKIAGSHVFKTVAEKRAYIHGNLKERYHVLLKTPEWSEDELDEMGYNLRHYITENLQCQEWIRDRLKWRNNENTAAVEIARVRSKLGAAGRNIVPQNARTKQLGKDSKE